MHAIHWTVKGVSELSSGQIKSSAMSMAASIRCFQLAASLLRSKLTDADIEALGYASVIWTLGPGPGAGVDDG